jgi:hypothetical protein
LWIGSDVNTLMKEASVVPNYHACLCDDRLGKANMLVLNIAWMMVWFHW